MCAVFPWGEPHMTDDGKVSPERGHSWESDG